MLNNIVVMIILLLLSFCTHAGDLGVVGQTYPIIEIDFLDFIQAKLAAMAVNGEMSKLQNTMQQNVTSHTERPRPVVGISKTKHNHSLTFDPSFMVAHDIKDATGKVIAQAGTHVNPLNYVAIHHPMVFINGDDRDEVIWLKNLMQNKLNDLKLVLIDGSVSQIANELKIPVYFDQEGKLTAKFHIQHVPAIVSQQGLQLLVREVAI